MNRMITLENMEPNPKKPIIVSFFRNIGYADQLGSDVRNLFKYSKYYSGGEPEFVEDDIFRIMAPLNDSYLHDDSQSTTQLDQNTTQSTTQIDQNTTQSTTQLDQSTTQSTTQLDQSTAPSISVKIIADMVALLEQEPDLSQKQIAERLATNVNTVKYYIRKMQKQGKIERVGTPHKGKWIVR